MPVATRGAASYQPANEVICFPRDGSSECSWSRHNDRCDAPGGVDLYSKLPKGNLDTTGQYFIWTSNSDSTASTRSCQGPPRGSWRGPTISPFRR